MSTVAIWDAYGNAEVHYVDNLNEGDCSNGVK